jgi:tricorn protease
MSPDDWAAERDTQLETAVKLALEALERRPARSGYRRSAIIESWIR